MVGDGRHVSEGVTKFLELHHGLLFVATKDHGFAFFNKVVACCLCLELFDEAGTGVPLGFSITHFVPSSDIRDKLEAIANLERLLEKLRVDIGPRISR